MESQLIHSQVEPVGRIFPWKFDIHKRRYFVPARNSLWHIDVVRWKHILHVCVDRKACLLIYCHSVNNNEAILNIFEHGVIRWGLPPRVKSSYRMENCLVASYSAKELLKNVVRCE